MRNRRLIGWVACGIALISLAMLGALVVGVRQAEAERAQRSIDRSAARSRWEAAGIARYSMTLDENGCRYTAEVRGTLSMIDGRQLNCIFQPTSIAALFDLLALDGAIQRLCDQRGCPCESITSVRGEYDEQLGYPRRVLIDIELRPAWLTSDLWQHLLADGAMPPCMRHQISDIRVLELTINDGQ